MTTGPTNRRDNFRVAVLLTTLLSLVVACTSARVEPTPVSAAEADALNSTVAIENVRVFDGETVIEQALVVIADGVIVSVGDAGAEIPSGALLVDGAGKTLLPGLIDSHTHTFGQASLQTAAQFGTTTHLDMFTAPVVWAFEQSAEQAETDTGPRAQADLFSAGILGTVAGGHGTQYGIPIPTIDEPSEAVDWVADRVAEGSDFIKLVVEDGSNFGRRVPSMDRATLQAGVAAAHEQDLLAVTHISTFEAAQLAIEADSDGLVHGFMDEPASTPLIDSMVEANAFIVPTLSVLSSASNSPSGRSLVDDPDLGPLLSTEDARNLNTNFPVNQSLDNVLASTGLMHQSGVPILAGSDAPNAGTAFGVSMHGELELLVRAGLTPVAALAAATSVPADTFSLDDRGRIAPGLVADLLLVDGDPTVDILATRSIIGVWKNGIPISDN